SDDAAGPLVARTAHENLHSAALREVAPIKRGKSFPDHEESPGQRRARMTSELDRVRVAIGDHAVARGAEEARQRIVDGERRGGVEERREDHRYLRKQALPVVQSNSKEVLSIL